MAAPQYLMLSERYRMPVPAIWLQPLASARDSTAMIQAALTEAAGKREVVLKPGTSGTSFYSIAGRLTAPANSTLILDGAEVRWASTASTGSTLLGVATRPGLEALGSNFRLRGWGYWTGPSSAAYVANEIGVFMKGTSSASRKTNLVIEEGIEFSKWGYAGVVAQYVNRIEMPRFHAHDCGHAGAFFFSCNHGRAPKVTTYTITPGDGSAQAYGFALTHDTDDYNLDDHVDGTIDTNGRLAANPFCQDWVVSGEAWDIPLWQGFDAHGGYEITFENISTYNCRHGVALSGSSGDAAAYAGANNTLRNIRCTTLKRDGSATTVSATSRTGINLSGGTTVKQSNVILDGFSTDGYGDNVVSSRSVQGTFVSGGVIANGFITNWKGQGILVGDAGSRGQIRGVEFGAVADATNSECIRDEYSSSAASWDIIECKHRAAGGTVAAEGLRVDASNGARLILGCDFTEATAPLAGIATTARLANSDVLTGSATFDPANLADGAGETTTVTVTGAALGDFAEASFSLALQGITLTAWVSPTDTVSVRFQNESGGALDLASGTLRARVRKV